MKKTIFIASILFCLISHAQNFNPKIITLSEHPTVDDFSFLKQEIKDAQVVMLGELTHQDGNVFEMKTKILTYLHQEMGFNTIAFESGIFDVWKAQNSINNGESTDKALKKALFTIWTKKKEFQSFMSFFQQNKDQLKLFGFDNQITGTFGEEELVKDLYKYCSQNNLKLKLHREDFELLLESMRNSGVFDEGDITYHQYKSALLQILAGIEKKPKLEEHFYWTQIIKSLLALGEYNFNKEVVLSTFHTTSDDNIRDKQMADNLLAYIKKYPNEKIICWGANQHFANDMSSINTPILKEFVPMGTYLKNILKDKVYSLATVTASDSIYLQNKWYKTPINPASFESYLKNNESPHLYISSNQPSMQQTQLNRLFSPVTFVDARLDLLHDGYLFFKNVMPATPIAIEDNELIEKEAQNNHTVALQNFDAEMKINALDEVVVYNKRTPYQIIKKAIDRFDKNYPSRSFNSTMHAKITTHIQDTTCLDLDLVSNQYDYSYTGNFRSMKEIKEIRWNIKNGYEPQNLREFHSLIYNNPIKHSALLDSRKFKKFIFTLEEIKNHNNKEVYVIAFSSPRNHSNFTKRVFLSNYSGLLYVNKDDYAIVKITENWAVTKFPEEHQQGLELTGPLAKYIKKEFVNEAIETHFVNIDNLYYITHSEINLTGHLLDIENKSLPFNTTINSSWSDFNLTNPKPISNRDEQHLFGKITFNKTFWETYKTTN